jgi:hypothetical protein
MALTRSHPYSDYSDVLIVGMNYDHLRRILKGLRKVAFDKKGQKARRE